nr:hypothetical protein [uncultured Halomonas sp.]
METSSALTKESMLNKVPEATLIFWIIKMMSTTVGETTADFLNFNLGFGLVGTSALTGLLLIAALFLQMHEKQYIPWKYWTTVVLTSIFGTLITDYLTDSMGVPLEVSTAFFSAALLITFMAWYAQEKTLSIHTIYTTKRETFYWIAILFTFALGTAAGDLAAEGVGLGFANSGLLFGALIALTALAYFIFKANAIACFWIAYVLTRPFGASFGDFLSQPISNGGLGLGATDTSLVFLATIIGLVFYITAPKKHLLLKK